MGQAGQIASIAGGSVEGSDGALATALVFRAGPLFCAMPLDEVIETMRPLAVQSVAGTPPFVRGLCIMRGAPTPVVDVARLLLGDTACAVQRFVAVGTDRGPVAFATGEVLGIRSVGDTGATRQHAELLGGAPMRLVAAVGTFDSAPLLVLQSMRILADEIWAAAAPVGTP